MSSKQLNFYITPKDHKKINEFISRKKAIVLLGHDISDKNNIGYKDKLPDSYIYKVYLTSHEFTNRIKINTVGTDSGNIKSFDILESYLLEFNLGGFFPNDTTNLQRARFYYVKSFWNEEHILEKKSNEFILWCDDFIKDFRKEFLKRFSKEKTFFYSSSAIEWIESNHAKEIPGGLGWKI